MLGKEKEYGGKEIMGKEIQGKLNDPFKSS